MLYKWKRPVLFSTWDNEIVVYQFLSGDTYLFSDLSKTLIEHCFSKNCFDNAFLESEILGLLESQQHVKDFVSALIKRLLNADLIISEGM